MLVRHLSIEGLLLKRMPLLLKGSERKVQLLSGKLLCTKLDSGKIHKIFVYIYFLFNSSIHLFINSSIFLIVLQAIIQVCAHLVILITSIIILVDRVAVVLLQLLQGYVQSRLVVMVVVRLEFLLLFVVFTD